MTESPLLPRDLVARHLGVSAHLLARYEARGLVRATKLGGVEGYEPHELRRLWSVVTLHREAGINLAGVECILRMRDQMQAMQASMTSFAEELRLIVEADLGHDVAE